MLMSAVHPPPSVTSMHSAPTLVGPISVRVKVDTRVMETLAKVGRIGCHLFHALISFKVKSL